jgi:hypothetical protein
VRRQPDRIGLWAELLAAHHSCPDLRSQSHFPADLRGFPESP